MISKLFWMFIIAAVAYTSVVFYAPSIADPIGNKIGLGGYNDFVRSFKTTLDGVATDIPSKDEFIEGGKAALSGAIDIKETVVDGIGTTKDTIDTVRSTLSGAEATYKDAKETFDQAKDFIEGASEKINDVKDTLEDVEKLGGSITDLVDTGEVEHVINQP